MDLRKGITCGALAAATALTLVGCQRHDEQTARNDTTAERRADTMADRTERGAERAGEATSNAGERTGNAMSNAGERSREAMSEAGEKAQGAAGRAGQFIDDATVTAKVKAQLAKDPDLKATQINVTTDNGVVKLTGTVDTDKAISHAAEVVRKVDGVQSVENNLVVKHESKG